MKPNHRRGPAPLVAAPLLAALLLAPLAACQGSPTTAARPSPSTPNDEQIVAIGRQYAQCVREHGVPAFPDLQLVDGALVLPPGEQTEAVKRALTDNPAVRDACQPIFERLPASARKPNSPVSASDVPALLRYADCIRRNGIPDWPDPDADGAFPIAGTALEAEGKSQRVRTAMQACRQHWDKGIEMKGSGRK